MSDLSRQARERAAELRAIWGDEGDERTRGALRSIRLLEEMADTLDARDEALREIIRREAVSEYSSIYAAPGEFAWLARAALADTAEEPK